MWCSSPICICCSCFNMWGNFHALHQSATLLHLHALHSSELEWLLLHVLTCGGILPLTALKDTNAHSGLKSYQARRYFKALENNSMSFFFTNFLDLHGIVDMWKVFSKWDVVGDVFIPQKRDKRGRRFGFVKFRKVEDLNNLKKNVWNGLYKMIVNTPSY
ncbi:hypothetical protein Lal_00026783 [Lupinus albus]|nr:hypothetical protein Lal_00026783 [Lupinus albus]